jgi:hypothetical protein
MGFGVNLVLIAIGAVLAFATHFTLSAINVHAVGWVFMAVGLIGMLISFAYVRPRRANNVVEFESDEPLAYDVRPDGDPGYTAPHETVVEQVPGEPAPAPAEEMASRSPWYRSRRRRVVRRTPHVVPHDSPDEF